MDPGLVNENQTSQKCARTLFPGTHNIDCEGIPSSSLIQTSADRALDWMEKGEMLRCAGERAVGLTGGEREREREKATS